MAVGESKLGRQGRKGEMLLCKTGQGGAPAMYKRGRPPDLLAGPGAGRRIALRLRLVRSSLLRGL